MALKDVGVRLVVEGSSQFKAAMGGAQKSVKGLGGALKRATPAMRKLGIGMAGAAVAIGGASLKMAADFESGMREVNTLINLSEEQLKGLSDQVLDLSKDLGVDAVESTRALYQAISAGIPAENALEFLEVASKAAIGGVTNTETAVDGLTTVINAFGLDIKDANKVADIMFATVKGGKTTFDELSRSMFQVAPIAAAANIEFTEVAAALATMTKQGVPTSVATTQLRQAIVAIQKPTKEMQVVIEELGFATGQVMLEELGFAKTLDVLREATGGNNEALFKMFGSIEAGQAVLALTGDNAQTFAADLAAVQAATEGLGASTEAFNEINKSTSRQFAIVKAKLKAVAIEIGTALIPAILKIIDKIKPLLDKLIDWISNNSQLAATILGAVGLVGALLVLAPLLTKLPLLIKAVAIALKFLFLNPIGLAIVAIVAWGIAIKSLADNWDVIWRGMLRLFQSIVNKIIDGINTVIRTINLIPGVNIGQIARFGAGGGGLTDVGRTAQEQNPEAFAELQARLSAPVANQQATQETTINVEANYTNPQDPASIALDLEYLTLAAEN